jgi:Ca2+/H+ antiporter
MFGMALIMNYKKHKTFFMVIALVGFLLLLLTPTYGAAIFLPAIGAYFGARKAQSDGPEQPSFVLWGVFFVFVAVAVLIRYLVPEENFGGFDQWPSSAGLFLFYSGVLAVAYLLFGYLAYLQRVGRTNS